MIFSLTEPLLKHRYNIHTCKANGLRMLEMAMKELPAMSHLTIWSTFDMVGLAIP